jgi:hypothetical protein
MVTVRFCFLGHERHGIIIAGPQQGMKQALAVSSGESPCRSLIRAYDASMTDTTEAPAQSVNGAAPAPAAEVPCEDCATGGERALAVVAGLFGLFIVGLAVDMFTGGGLSKLIGRALGGVAGD